MATCVVKPQGSKVTVIEVDGKALMLAGKLSLSRRAINGGTCGHPCVAWQIFTGPSRRRTSPKVSLNSSVTPGFMMCWCCLLLSNSHEEVAAPLPPAHPEGRHQRLHGRKVFTGLAAERAPVRVPAAWRAWPQLKVWRSGTQPPRVARRFPRGRCVFLVLVVEASDENHEAPPAPRSPCTPAWRTSSSS